MTYRVTQKMLDFAIERLQTHTKCKITTNDCYGYSQLAIELESGGIEMFDASHGDSKKDLYYQIQFCLDFLRKNKDKSNHWKKGEKK